MHSLLVLQDRDHFKVVGIDAEGHSAQMVHLHAGGDIGAGGAMGPVEYEPPAMGPVGTFPLPDEYPPPAPGAVT